MIALVATANVVVSIAYLLIARLVGRRLLALRIRPADNPLAYATAMIFFSCGIGHLLHLSQLVLHPEHVSSMYSWEQAIWDSGTASIGVWYWTLRSRYAALVPSGSLFEDAGGAFTRLLADATDTLGDGILLIEPGAAGLMIRQVNVAAAAVFGLPVTGMLDRPLHDLAEVAWGPVLAEGLQGVLDSGEDWTHDFGWVEGERWDGSFDVVARRFGDGLVVGVRDTSTRTLERRAARAAEADLLTVFRSAPSGTALLDLTGEVIRANPALGRLLDCDTELLTGRVLAELVHPEDRAEFASRLARLLEDTSGGEPDDGAGSVPDLELRMLRPGPDFAVPDPASCEHRWAQASLAVVHRDGAPWHYLAQFLDITERKRYETQLTELAVHDPLTGLLNRRGFDAELARHCAMVRRYGARGSVLLLDLDHFKVVNDTLGHPEGDQLIVSVAHLLRDAARTTDVVARLGGDEFAVLLPEGGEDDAVELADRVIATVRRSSALLSGDRPGRVTVSIGVRVIDASADPQAVMVDVDTTLYDAKDAGRDRYAVFRQGDHTASRMKSRLAWLELARQALDNGAEGMVLASQPIIELATGQITHEELLIRMRQPDGTLALPGSWLYVVEQHGLIADLDAWVLRNGIARAAEHWQAGVERVVCVNLSGRSLGSQALLDLLTHELAASGVPADRLVVEVTETAAVANMALARGFLEQVRALGVGVALDDFGAGFGSFYYLKHLPFDYLKLDGEFVAGCLTNETDRLVIAAVVGLAGGLGKRVIAEHVTSREVGAFLTTHGVHYAQGYSVGRPQLLEHTPVPAQRRHAPSEQRHPVEAATARP